MTNEVILTSAKLEDLKKQLYEYKHAKRLEVAKRIEEAKEYGDLSENSEYEEAKNQQAFVEGKIAEIEEIIKNATIVDQKASVDGKIVIGSSVSLKTSTGQKLDYMLVGALESDPSHGKISIDSPVGKAFMNKRQGDKIVVSLPTGKSEFEVLTVR
jgi:transcription elongation factor GreA